MSESVRYASGEVPEVGDIVQCVSDKSSTVSLGEQYMLTTLESDDIHEFNDLVFASPCRFKLLRRREKPLPALDGAGVFHVAESCKSCSGTGSVERTPTLSQWSEHGDREQEACGECDGTGSAPDWQPFDGTFREGVEYRSKDGIMCWLFARRINDASQPVKLHFADDQAMVFSFSENGRFLPGDNPNFWDITHQRPAAAPEPVVDAKTTKNFAEAIRRKCEADPQLATAVEAESEIRRLQELVRHMWVHDGYPRNGYMQMTTEQKAMYDAIIESDLPPEPVADAADINDVLRPRAMTDEEADGLRCAMRQGATTPRIPIQPVAPAAPAPQAGTVERFTLTFVDTIGHVGYKVSIPNYEGGEVVRAADYDAMQRRCESAERAIKDRDFAWWESLCLVDSVAPTPEAVKEWVISESEYHTKLKLSTLTAERDALQRRLDASAAAVGGAKGGA